MSENIQNYFRLALTSESPARHQPKALLADAFASMFLILELGGIGQSSDAPTALLKH